MQCKSFNAICMVLAHCCMPYTSFAQDVRPMLLSRWRIITPLPHMRHARLWLRLFWRDEEEESTACLPQCTSIEAIIKFFQPKRNFTYIYKVQSCSWAILYLDLSLLPKSVKTLWLSLAWNILSIRKQGKEGEISLTHSVSSQKTEETERIIQW
jgi:hypothetical protein